LASMIVRPAFASLRLMCSLPTIIGYALILFAFYSVRQNENAEQVIIQVTDMAGKPVPAARVDYNCISDMEKSPIHDVNSQGRADGDGRLVITLYAISSLTLEVRAGDQYVRILSDGPNDKTKGPIHVGYFWPTPFAQNAVRDIVP